MEAKTRISIRSKTLGALIQDARLAARMSIRECSEALGVGDTEGEAIAAARESALAGVCVMLEAGEPVPAPKGSGSAD